MLKDHFGGIGDADLEAGFDGAGVDLLAEAKEALRLMELHGIGFNETRLRAAIAQAESPTPPPEQWRLDAFPVGGVGDLIGEVIKSTEAARLSEKYFKGPQDALAAWNDGLPSIMWTLFAEEIEARSEGQVFIVFQNEAAEAAVARDNRMSARLANEPVRPPTERMIAAAEKVAAEKGLDLPDLTSGAAVRSFLNENGDKKLGAFKPRAMPVPKGGPRL